MCTHLNKTNSTYYFRRPVPDDLVGHFTTATGKPRTEWKFSLRTKDREQAKRLLRPHVAETDKLIDEARAALLRASPASLEELAAQQREREELAAEAALVAASRARQEARADLRTLWRQRRRMSTAELAPEQAAAVDLIKEKDAELEELRRAVAIMQAGNERLAGNKAATPAAVKLMDLFDRWATLPGRHEKVVDRWRVYVEGLVSFLGHSDAARIERGDLIRWRTYLRDEATYRGKRLSAKTINDSYLAAVNAVLAYAVGDDLLSANPMDGVTKITAPKAVELRDRDLTKEEAQTILGAAMMNPDDDRRWVPWLMAYTGTRVGEPAQLRKEDVLTVDGVHVLRLTPDAGPIKNRKARLVPIHSHLIELGFLDFVKGKPEGPLFGRTPDQISRRVGDWVRALGITAPQPNHCWRHTFKTVARGAGIPKDVADRIQGHAPGNEGGQYGGFPVAMLRDEIERIPRYELHKVG